ncbi:MAG: winged helix-turn-helix domain-containing protein [Candidatus Freyarchaeota archaeon]|nr:winged helix-turn-helix domain-containing protein [Candidatus Jordarchaeia archaeon]MBS7267535.1 winged helix-turn-helix domain-containing protein [Candidatus Jordarchaeia archaeon]MBS7278393.1 winged helix-turn-helix domain-containing protein [Candidatus Jordarchaeia archaeon]
MSEEDERVRRSAIRLVAEIQSVQQSSQFEVNSFFESLRRELFDSEKTTFSNMDMSRILSRLQNLIMDLLNQIVDRVSVEAVKQIQIILGDLKNVRESELLAEKTTSAVRRDAMDYRLNKYIQDLENHIKLLEERESARKKMLKNVLTRDKKYQILALLENGKELSYTEISKQLSLTRTKVNEYIKELEKNNLVSVDKNKKPYLISLKQTLWL